MINQLKHMFLGQRVRISHTNTKVKTREAFCVDLGEGRDGQRDGEYSILIMDGELEVLAFIPEVLDDTSVDGDLPGDAGGRRKIEVIRAEEKIATPPRDVRTFTKPGDENHLSNANILLLRANVPVTLNGPFAMHYDHRPQIVFQVAGVEPDRFVIESEFNAKP